MELASGVVARRLAPLHASAVASWEYWQGAQPPRQPHELAMLDGLSMRSAHTGRVRVWRMRNREGVETTLEHKARIVANDPEAICRAALMGLGVAMIAVPYVERHLESGALQRLLPDWHADLGAISLYFTSQKLLPPKTPPFAAHLPPPFPDPTLP